MGSLISQVLLRAKIVLGSHRKPSSCDLSEFGLVKINFELPMYVVSGLQVCVCVWRWRWRWRWQVCVCVALPIWQVCVCVLRCLSGGYVCVLRCLSGRCVCVWCAAYLAGMCVCIALPIYVASVLEVSDSDSQVCVTRLLKSLGLDEGSTKALLRLYQGSSLSLPERLLSLWLLKSLDFTHEACLSATRTLTRCKPQTTYMRAGA